MFNVNIVMFEYFKNNFVFIVIFVLENLLWRISKDYL